MYVIVMGCGRVGALLAKKMAAAGHEVAVIDSDPVAFQRLEPDFQGQMIVGQGFDRDILIEAGIERADAFAAASSGDNTNLIASRVAREGFNVKHVVSRVYDQDRALVYERLGIPAVTTVPWAAQQFFLRLTGDREQSSLSDPTGAASIIPLDVNEEWLGRPMSELERETGGRVAFVIRYGNVRMPTMRTLVQPEETLWLAIPTDGVNEARRIASFPPEED